MACIDSIFMMDSLEAVVGGVAKGQGLGKPETLNPWKLLLGE